MGQEEVADLLNEMSPDDRTWFLSELPASVTKQLLSLLTQEERAEAVTLQGSAPQSERSENRPFLLRVFVVG